MSELRQGMVAKVFKKEVKPGFTLHSFCLVDDDSYYGTHTTQPKRGDGSAVQEGDLVKFSCEKTKYGMQVIEGTLKVKAGTGAPPKPANKSTGNKGGENWDARAKYWDEKEKYDKEVTSKMINYRSAQMQAVSLVTVALDKGILPVAGKAKEGKFESFIEIVDKIKLEIYTDLCNQALALERGEDPALVAAEIEPLTDDVVELEELEKTQEPEPTDDWEDDDWEE